jgi:hypothetical protein
MASAESVRVEPGTTNQRTLARSVARNMWPAMSDRKSLCSKLASKSHNAGADLSAVHKLAMREVEVDLEVDVEMTSFLEARNKDSRPIPIVVLQGTLDRLRCI